MNKGFDYVGTGVCFYCHDGKGNFVMNLRSQNCRDEHGRWDQGGGGVEFGERIEDTLRKEIKEEYCADVLKHEFLGFRDVHREFNGEKSHWLILDFKVLVDRNEVQNGEPHKFEKIDWFKLNNLPDNLHSQSLHFFEKYKDKLCKK